MRLGWDPHIVGESQALSGYLGVGVLGEWFDTDANIPVVSLRTYHITSRGRRYVR